jgi:hypothetical protein
MKQIIVLEINIPHDQYGFEPDELAESIASICNPEVRFHATAITERADIARIESMLRD